MSKTDELIDTQARNQRFMHYDTNVVMVPFGHVRMLVRKHHQQQDAIKADPHLTSEGKVAAVDKARAATRASIGEWHAQRDKDLAADELAQRAALLEKIERPDPKRVDLMTSHLLKHTPSDIAIFYNGATDAERREMEAASVAVGRVPMKTASGFEWKTLLDQKMVDEAIVARMEATNPTAAQKLRELGEIRAMQTTITQIALSDL